MFIKNIDSYSMFVLYLEICQPVAQILAWLINSASHLENDRTEHDFATASVGCFDFDTHREPNRVIFKIMIIYM